MNSLVVLFSVVVLASASPSGLLGYPAPLIAAPAIRTVVAAPAFVAAPAAVSHQSRIDIKSSPAVVATAPVAYAAPVVAPVAKTVIAAPAVVAAPAAVSQQSRIDIKSSPAIVSTYAAAPIAYAAAPVATAYAAPIVKTIATPAIAAPIIAGPAVPLETPEVIAARAAHFQAKAAAFTGHAIRKRSVVAPLISTYASAPVITAPVAHAYAAPAIAPLAYSAPLTYPAPLITKAYGIHPW